MLFSVGLLGAISVLAQPSAKNSQLGWKGSVAFLEDSVRIGDPTPIVVTLSYPADWQVLLPDSTADFGTFEYHSRRYTPTRTVNTISFDSAVYYLATFEIDEEQGLRLPFWIIEENDSSQFWLGGDSIIFWDVVVPMPDTIQYRSQAYLPHLPREFNTPYALAIGGSILIAVLIAILVLLRPIRRWWKRRKLERNHKRWLETLEGLTPKLGSAKVEEGIPEQWIVLWKKYLEKLDGEPYTAFTTRELSMQPGVRELEESLRQFDRAIYGQRQVETLSKEAERLKSYALKQYQSKLENISA